MKKLIFSVLFLFTVFISAEDSDYLENVTLEPSHGYLNYDGKVKILYDLPKDDLVLKVYLSVVVGQNEIVVEPTVTDSGFGYLNNVLTLNGSDLYEIIKNEKGPGGFVNDRPASYLAVDSDIQTDDETAPDEDAADNDIDDSESPDLEENDDDIDFIPSDKARADGVYKIKLTVELDTSTTTNDDDDEKDDSDTEKTTTTTTVPANVSQYVTVVFDNISPAKPQELTTEGGDQRIIIRITPPVDPEDSEKNEKIGKYHVTLSGWFDNDGTETLTELKYTTEVSSASYDEMWEFSATGKDGFEIINNDKKDPKYNYKVTVYAEDVAGNADPSKTISVDDASAITTYGFWSNYDKENYENENGGKDDGGFCFIATAGFGSYFHPNVKILRNFRDSVLAKFEYGRKFIRAYYDLGRVPAEIISDHSILKSFSRAVLMPLVVLAWLLTTTAGNIIIALWMMIFTVFLFAKFRNAGKVVLPVIVLGIMTYSGSLYGVDGEFSFNSSFYYPEHIDDGMVDTADGNKSVKPFKDIGGSELRYLPSLTFGFALPIPVVKDYIRWSLIGGIGYTRFKGTSRDAAGEKTADKTEMHFIPLMAEMKIRPVYWFPVWPYATIGIDYYTWWIREKGKTAEDGGTFGFHGNFGLLISLNWLDEGSSKKFEESTGITNSGLFVHYRLEKINDFNKKESFDLTGSRFEFGILFEF